MPRELDGRFKAFLSAFGDGAPTPEEKAVFLREFRGQSGDRGGEIDLYLLQETHKLRKGLEDSRANYKDAKKVMEKLTADPWHEAVLIGYIPGSADQRAMVFYGNGSRAVTVSRKVDPDSLVVGDKVYLSDGLNVILAKSEGPPCGDIAVFSGFTGKNGMALKWRDEETIVYAARPGLVDRLKPGDQVLWSRVARVVYEKLERSEESDLFLEETPRETFQQIGGLSTQIEEIKSALSLRIEHPQIVHKYHLEPTTSILMEGPPGTGKTMMAKALANWLATLSRSGRSRFINIKPSALHSVWYSESERNYREAFRIARKAGDQDPDVPVVMFFDEVDSVAAARGQSHMRVDDRIVMALAAELDGLESRGNILVVSATNRREALDPKLDRPGRLSDLVLEVPRPDRSSAGDIIEKYLRGDIPYARNGHGPDLKAARRALIESVISRIYAPNGAGDLATLMFRDGSRRPLRPADLVSGAMLKKIACRGVERAAKREALGGEPGLTLPDLLAAADESLETAVRSLSPGNCHRHLSGLPGHTDVIDVAIPVRRDTRPHRVCTLVSK